MLYCMNSYILGLSAAYLAGKAAEPWFQQTLSREFEFGLPNASVP